MWKKIFIFSQADDLQSKICVQYKVDTMWTVNNVVFGDGLSSLGSDCCVITAHMHNDTSLSEYWRIFPEML